MSSRRATNRTDRRQTREELHLLKRTCDEPVQLFTLDEVEAATRRARRANDGRFAGLRQEVRALRTELATQDELREELLVDLTTYARELYAMKPRVETTLARTNALSRDVVAIMKTLRYASALARFIDRIITSAETWTPTTTTSATPQLEEGA